MKRNTIEFIAGSIIKQVRKTSGDPKLDLVAMQTGICKSKLSKIETGNQLLDFATLHLLCKYYDVSMSAVIALMERQLYHLPPPSKTRKRTNKEHK